MIEGTTQVLLPFFESALGQSVRRNTFKMKRLFFTFVCIPMKGMVLGQMGDKCLKLLAFFITIISGSP
jgi:hypothetical protein